MEEIVGNIERIYESANIYNAIFVLDEWSSEIQHLYEILLEKGYPVGRYRPNMEYLFKLRLLFILVSEVEDFLATDRNNFNMVLTCEDRVFDLCLDIPQCEDMTIVRV